MPEQDLWTVQVTSVVTKIRDTKNEDLGKLFESLSKDELFIAMMALRILIERGAIDF